MLRNIILLKSIAKWIKTKYLCIALKNRNGQKEAEYEFYDIKRKIER